MCSKEDIDRVLDQIDSDELINLTSSLVKLNTTWDPDAGTSEQIAADFIASWAENQGFDTRIDEVSHGRSNVIVTWHAGPGSKTLMFEGHTDVVTPGDTSAWTYDPFGAEIVKNRMYGRGTNDTKGNLAAMLIAMAALRRSGVSVDGTIIGGVLCDEEDGMTGVLDFINRGHADKVTAAVICEPQDGLVCTCQKGAIRAEFTITGKMSHGAMPLSGLNTAPAVAQIINGLAALESRAFDSPGKDRLLGWPSFTPTVIRAPASGPAQLNVVPGEAKILVDIRTVPGQSHDQIRSDLEGLASMTALQVTEQYKIYDRRIKHCRQHDIDVSVKFLTDRPCTFTDADHPVVKAVSRASLELTGREPEYAGVPGATDGTFLWAMKNIPIVTFGAGDRQVPHQVDEWVDLDQLVLTAKIYAVAALKYLNAMEEN